MQQEITKDITFCLEVIQKISENDFYSSIGTPICVFMHTSLKIKVNHKGTLIYNAEANLTGKSCIQVLHFHFPGLGIQD